MILQTGQKRSSVNHGTSYVQTFRMKKKKKKKKKKKRKIVRKKFYLYLFYTR